MARARNIKPAFFTNEIIGTIDPIIGMTFIGLWCLADRDGRLEDRPIRIKGELFPYRDGVDVNGYLTVLEREGFIERYEVDGLKLVQIIKFGHHQTPHNTEKAKGYPANPSSGKAPKQITVTQQLNLGEITEAKLPDSLIPDSLIPEVSVAKATSSAVRSIDTASGFDEFWKVWPASQRKTGRAKCLDRWKRYRLALMADEIIAHVQAMKTTPTWLSGFEPAPGRYLTERRWEDGGGVVAYSPEELVVINAYNETLSAEGWPEAVADPYSPERAGAIREFLTFSAKPEWVENYFGWFKANLKPKAGYGFDWVIRKDTFIRAREGNFAALQEAA